MLNLWGWVFCALFVTYGLQKLQKKKFLHLCLVLFNFYWSIVDLQWCVSFRCTAKSFSYLIYTCIYSFSKSFPIYVITQPLLTPTIRRLGRWGPRWPVQQNIQTLDPSLGSCGTQAICPLWVYKWCTINLASCFVLGRKDTTLYCRAASRPPNGTGSESLYDAGTALLGTEAWPSSYVLGTLLKTLEPH